jgi:hypothetical protein
MGADACSGFGEKLQSAFDIIKRFAKVDRYACSMRVDRLHPRHLIRALLKVRLVDTGSIYPHDSLSVCISEACQSLPKAVGDIDTAPFDTKSTTSRGGTPNIRRNLIVGGEVLQRDRAEVTSNICLGTGGVKMKKSDLLPVWVQGLYFMATDTTDALRLGRQIWARSSAQRDL